ELQSLLVEWCLASGAKFNPEKQKKILPIGARTHRENVVRSRCISRNEPPLDSNLNSGEDGYAVRSIRPRIGN
ncbi:hypothetical protein BKA82DRAFT_111061, partial [Pisolithus tinctorius]